MPPAIIVMVKAPLPGVAKTRLSPPLSASEAASLAMCFVQDVIASARTVTSELIVAFTPDEGRATLQESIPYNLLWFAQQGNHLGERLNSALAYAAGLGFTPIVALGADSPTLPPSILETALHALSSDQADVVLGPTSDGGYYLVGVQKPLPQIFDEISWSSAVTFAQTARNVNKRGLRLLTTEPWYDVDTFADVEVLSSELVTYEEARHRAPITFRWLQANNCLPLPRD